MSLAINRASMARPVPMDVDKVAEDCEHEHEEEGWNHEEQYTHEIGYVDGACFRCGGVGPNAHECPTPNGKRRVRVIIPCGLVTSSSKASTVRAGRVVRKVTRRITARRKKGA